MSVPLRRGTAADAAAVKDLFHRSYGATFGHSYKPGVMEQWLEESCTEARFAEELQGAGFATFWTAFLPGAFLAGTFFAGAFLAGAFLAVFLGALFFTVFFAAFFAGREGFRSAFFGFFFFVAMLYLSFRTVPCRTPGNNPGFR